MNEDEQSVKEQVKGFGCQIVKINLDVDPISNLCKGRGKITLRYNPEYNGLPELIERIRSLGWSVMV